MPKLNIIVATGDGARFYAALETAMALAALGRTVRLFMQGEAAQLLRQPVVYGGDAARKAAGQPDLAGMVAQADAMEVALAVCQSGMVLAGMTAAMLPEGVEATGLVGWLANAEPGDQMLVY